MKPIKMFGLAALAALMAMAFVGASSAMAESTALCSTESEPCEAISHVHETSVGKAKLLSEPTVECDVLFLGDTVAETSKPLHVSGKFTYTNCNNSCAVEEVNGPALIAVLKTATELSAVTGKGLVKLTCFFGFIKCAYNGEGLEGHGTGPLKSAQKNGSVVITEQETKIENGTCPESAFLDITTTPLEATYIVSGLHYCVDYSQNNGFYADSGCTERATTQTKLYELVVANSGFKVGEVLCVNKRTLIGLWKVRNAGICEEMDFGNTSLYEKGTITAIKN